MKQCPHAVGCPLQNNRRNYAWDIDGEFFFIREQNMADDVPGCCPFAISTFPLLVVIMHDRILVINLLQCRMCILLNPTDEFWILP